MRAPWKTRIIDGRSYFMANFVRNKNEAKRQCSNWRKGGNLARTVKYGDGYAILVHRGR